MLISFENLIIFGEKKSVDSLPSPSSNLAEWPDEGLFQTAQFPRFSVQNKSPLRAESTTLFSPLPELGEMGIQ